MAVTRETLDQMKCSRPDCNQRHGPIFLNPRCHPGAYVEARYDQGVLSIRCAKCKTPVLDVLVARTIGNATVERMEGRLS